MSRNSSKGWMEAVANDAAVVEIHGQLIGKRGEHAIANFGNLIQAIAKILKAGRVRRDETLF